MADVGDSGVEVGQLRAFGQSRVTPLSLIASDITSFPISRLAVALADGGRQVLICRQEFGPPRLRVAAVMIDEVSGEVFDVDLHPGPVGGELV